MNSIEHDEDRCSLLQSGMLTPLLTELGAIVKEVGGPARDAAVGYFVYGLARAIASEGGALQEMADAEWEHWLRHGVSEGEPGTRAEWSTEQAGRMTARMERIQRGVAAYAAEKKGEADRLLRSVFEDEGSAP